MHPTSIVTTGQADHPVSAVPHKSESRQFQILGKQLIVPFQKYIIPVDHADSFLVIKLVGQKKTVGQQLIRDPGESLPLCQAKFLIIIFQHLVSVSF